MVLKKKKIIQIEKLKVQARFEQGSLWFDRPARYIHMDILDSNTIELSGI